MSNQCTKSPPRPCKSGVFYANTGPSGARPGCSPTEPLPKHNLLRGCTMGSKRPGHSTRARPAQPALPHPTADPSTIPRGVREAIEHQRLQLTRASTALTCLWIATLYQDWHEVEIDAADVALLTRRVIDEANQRTRHRRIGARSARANSTHGTRRLAARAASGDPNERLEFGRLRPPHSRVRRLPPALPKHDRVCGIFPAKLPPDFLAHLLQDLH